MDKRYKFRSSTIYLAHSLTMGTVDIKGYVGFDVEVDGKTEIIAAGYNFAGELITSWGDRDEEIALKTPPGCPAELRKAMDSWKRVLNMADHGVSELQFIEEEKD